MRKLMIVLISILLLSACSTIDSVKPGTGGSTFEVIGKSYDEVWQASIRTASRSLTIVESNKQTGTIRAEKGAGLATWGEVVGIFVQQPDKNVEAYLVEVQSLKRSTLQITGQDWTTTMIAGIKAELGI